MFVYIYIFKYLYWMRKKRKSIMTNWHVAGVKLCRTVWIFKRKKRKSIMTNGHVAGVKLCRTVWIFKPSKIQWNPSSLREKFCNINEDVFKRVIGILLNWHLSTGILSKLSLWKYPLECVNLLGYTNYSLKLVAYVAKFSQSITKRLLTYHVPRRLYQKPIPGGPRNWEWIFIPFPPSP